MSNEKNSMIEILARLRQVSPGSMSKKVETAQTDLLEAAKHDVDLQVAMTSNFNETSVTVQNYRIDIILNEFAGRKKRFYNIVENKTNKIIHQDLALFETAMGIVKKYMTGKNGIEDLEKYDVEYSTALYEVWTHQTRTKRGINEDISIAKTDAAKVKVAEAKRKIIKRL